VQNHQCCARSKVSFPYSHAVQAIESLPLVQTPEVFGLHANADIQYYTNATRELWRNLVELQPRTTSSGSGVTREDFIGNVARDVLAKVPDAFDMAVIEKAIGVPSPTQVVLLQELERWNQCAPLLKQSVVPIPALGSPSFFWNTKERPAPPRRCRIWVH